MKIAKLGFGWRQGLKRRLRLRFSTPARSAVLRVPVVIAKASNMLTWHRAACHFYKPTMIITFDEAPVAFNAAYLRRMVLFDGEEAVNWTPPEESKRMSTLILAVGYDLCSNKVLFLQPILIMKGKNDLKKAERAQYSPEVDVLV